MAVHGVDYMQMRTQTDILETKILTLLEKHGELSRKDLLNLLRSEYANLRAGTYDWILYKLKSKGSIQNVGWGIYKSFSKPIYKPIVSEALKRLYRKIQKKYDLDTLIIWETKWLNEFMIHQPFHSIIVLELDQDSLESVFYFLRDMGRRDVFLRNKPKKEKQKFEELINSYISESDKPVIIQRSIARAPDIKVNKITVPKLEKILVDIYSDPILFNAYQGNELHKIFSYAYRQYNINSSLLFSYAARRGKRKDLKDFLHTEILL